MRAPEVSAAKDEVLLLDEGKAPPLESPITSAPSSPLARQPGAEDRVQTPLSWAAGTKPGTPVVLPQIKPATSAKPSGSPRPTGRLDLSLRTTGTFSDWGDDSTPANSRPVSPSRLGPPGFLANTLTPPPVLPLPRDAHLTSCRTTNLMRARQASPHGPTDAAGARTDHRRLSAVHRLQGPPRVLTGAPQPRTARCKIRARQQVATKLRCWPAIGSPLGWRSSRPRCPSSQTIYLPTPPPAGVRRFHSARVASAGPLARGFAHSRARCRSPLSPAARRITTEMKAARERRANGEPEPGEPDDGAAPEPEAPVVDDGGVDESAPAEEE